MHTIEKPIHLYITLQRAMGLNSIPLKVFQHFRLMVPDFLKTKGMQIV